MMIDIPVPDFESIEESESQSEFRVEEMRSENLSIRHITREEFVEKMLRGGMNERIDIVDCRYEYEYEGGHIQGAKSINSFNIIEEYFNVPDENCSYDNISIVFHCEFSKNRGPEIASLFRKIDRMINYQRYPFIYYKNIYILQGGYRSFYSKYPEYCFGSYLTMDSNQILSKRGKHDRSNLIHSYFHTNHQERLQISNVVHSFSQPIFLNTSFQLPQLNLF